jgi:hypothetical protein
MLQDEVTLDLIVRVKSSVEIADKEEQSRIVIGYDLESEFMLQWIFPEVISHGPTYYIGRE